MTEYEIKNNIRYNEDLAESYQNQMRALEEQINNLECLKSKFATLQTNFGGRQDARKKCLSGISDKTAKIKTAAQYYSGMNDLLSGSEFLSAYNGLSDAKDTVVREQDKLYTQIDDLAVELNDRKQRITYWKIQLKNLKLNK